MRNGDSSGSRLSKKVHLSKGFFCVILSQKINKKITSMAANKLLPEKSYMLGVVADPVALAKYRL